MKSWELLGTISVDRSLDLVIVDGDESVISCDVHAISECLLIEHPNGERYIGYYPYGDGDKVIKKVNVICANDYWPEKKRTTYADKDGDNAKD